MSERKLVFQSERVFQLWDSTPSHKGFLIRSGIDHDPERTHTLDLMFHATRWVCLPMDFECVELYLISYDTQDVEVKRFLASSGLAFAEWDRLFKVESRGQHRGYVNASFLTVLQNRLDSRSTPLDCVYKASVCYEDIGEILVEIPSRESRQKRVPPNR